MGSSAFAAGLLAALGGRLGLLDLGLLLDQEGVQLEGLGQDDVADGAAADGELVELDGVLVCVGGGVPLMVILTFCRKVFILMSTPLMEPTTIVPFFSSIVTVSFFSFIRNLTSFISTQQL